jgi:DNA-binding NarL/FixJ family response regulator
MQKRVLQVLVVDSDPILREVLVEFLDTCDDLNPVGSAATGREGIRMCRELVVDLVLTEFRLPDMDGLEVIRQMRQHCPTSPIVVLATTSDSTQMVDALDAGATGWVEKGMPSDTLITALRKAGYNGHLQK